MDHAALRELTAGAALEDLEPLERMALDEHLATCTECRGLAAELDELMADLALAAETREPPATLERGVLDAIRSTDGASRAPLAADEPAPDANVIPFPRAVGRPSSRLPAVAGLAAAAVFGVVAVGLGVRGQALEADLAAARAEQAVERAVLAVAADPSHRTAGLQAPTGPSATVVWVPGTDESFLVSHNLPASPAGQVYQLWHADGSGIHGLGTFTHDGQGPAIAPFGVDLATSSAAMVTLEPAGGAQAEPGPQVVFGEL
jgi:anti-sigma factor RsiW